MEYAEKGSLADALRTGRFKRGSTGFPDLATIIACLQDVANGALPLSILTASRCSMSFGKSALLRAHVSLLLMRRPKAVQCADLVGL